MTAWPYRAPETTHEAHRLMKLSRLGRWWSLDMGVGAHVRLGDMNAKLLSLISSGVDVRFPARTDSSGRYMCICSRRGVSVAASGSSPEDALDRAIGQLDEAQMECSR